MARLRKVIDSVVISKAGSEDVIDTLRKTYGNQEVNPVPTSPLGFTKSNLGLESVSIYKVLMAKYNTLNIKEEFGVIEVSGMGELEVDVNCVKVLKTLMLAQCCKSDAISKILAKLFTIVLSMSTRLEPLNITYKLTAEEVGLEPYYDGVVKEVVKDFNKFIEKVL